MRYPSAGAVLNELRFLGADPSPSALASIQATIAAAGRDALDAFVASLFVRCFNAPWAAEHGNRIAPFCVSLAYRANDVDIEPEVGAMAPMAFEVSGGAQWWALIHHFRRLRRRAGGAAL